MTDPTTQPDLDATVTEQRIELGVTGQHLDVKNKYGSGHLRPSHVTLAYQTSGLRAHVYGRWVREDGVMTDASCSQPYTADGNDTSDWPGWLAQLATDHAPVAEVHRLRAELDRRTEDLAFLERTTLPELRRSIEHHKDGKQRWRDRAEKAEARVWELERPAVEKQRNEIRQSFTELIAQAEQDRDHEGAFDVQCRLREREEQWTREDAAVRPAPTARASTHHHTGDSP
ncbi:hypothetical protein AB0F30_16780 [Streptomyces sp. NPDC029006]|uniref:hypothetical protein n=1 Tax=Streptomyces sp. NPDC029006 TaxID=3155467 RepID=UPI0033D9689A